MQCMVWHGRPGVLLQRHSCSETNCDVVTKGYLDVNLAIIGPQTLHVLAIYGTWDAAAEVVRLDGFKLAPIKTFDSGEDCAQQTMVSFSL